MLDGRLDDPCWRPAVLLPPGPPDQPVRPQIRLCRDESRFYVGASFPSSAEACFLPQTTATDAAGAVDGIKHGRYAFHTNCEPNPWWQVDLGTRQTLGKIVIYNRLDYPPGLHNADILVILTSDDGKTWSQCYDNQGHAFGGITDGKPLGRRSAATAARRCGNPRSPVRADSIAQCRADLPALGRSGNLRSGGHPAGAESGPAPAGRAEQSQYLVQGRRLGGARPGQTGTFRSRSGGGP